jgi:hypothetical protein
MADQNKVLVAQGKSRRFVEIVVCDGILTGDSYLTSPMITVIVGPKDQDGDKIRSQTFFVHKDLITSRSRFFAKALKDYTGSKSVENEGGKSSKSEIGGISWLEGEEGVVKMPEDEPEVFANYIQLLYYGTIPIYNELEQVPASNTLDNGTTSKREFARQLEHAVALAARQEYNTLAKMYVLCEKIQDTAAKRSVFAAFVEATTKSRVNNDQHYPVYSTVRLIYAGTLTSDPLRTFVTDCHVLVGHSGWVASADDYPHEFLYDVTLGMFKERAVSDAKARLRLKDTETYLKKLDVLRSRARTMR